MPFMRRPASSRSAWIVPFVALYGLLFGIAPARATPDTYTPAEIRAHFHARLDRPKVPLQPITSAEVSGDLVIERGQFHSEAHQAVPFLAVKRADARGRLAAVLVLHGTGGNKQDMLGTLKDLAKRGLFALAIDARYHGDRIPGGAHGAQEYQDAILRAWQETDPKQQEHPLYYDTVYDVWRTVDYLETRPDVDAKRIGLLGFSMGGIETWLAAATDERFRVVVPAIAVQSFRWSLENERWQGRAATVGAAHAAVAKALGEQMVNARVCRALWNKVIPSILDEFDCPMMLRAIAPRPLLILNGEKDPNNPLEGAKIAFAAATQAYKEANAEDRLGLDVAPGVGHAVTNEQRQKAYAWLERWLRK